ncbi:MAG: hypothetical protein IJY52_03500, partial [Anaerotignum sp.]|nr:hypothetical protein [Anaerotignum sp.]
FLAITGDINPLHNDQEFAQKQGHPDKVAFGMLTASFLSTLAGVYLPGRYREYSASSPSPISTKGSAPSTSITSVA